MSKTERPCFTVTIRMFFGEDDVNVNIFIFGEYLGFDEPRYTRSVSSSPQGISSSWDPISQPPEV